MTALQKQDTHPSAGALALYSSGDLSWRSRWAIGRHLAKCTECEHDLLLFRSASAELKREAAQQTLSAFEAVADWSVLEREMLGNISVGLAAGRCIEKVRRKTSPFLRTALVVAGLMAVFIAGWFTHIPKAQNEHLLGSLRRIAGLDRGQVSGTVVQTMPDGIAVRAQGATLTIMHPRSALVSLSGASGVAARYVDAETGEVTVASVYGQ